MQQEKENESKKRLGKAHVKKKVRRELFRPAYSFFWSCTSLVVLLNKLLGVELQLQLSVCREIRRVVDVRSWRWRHRCRRRRRQLHFRVELTDSTKLRYPMEKLPESKCGTVSRWKSTSLKSLLLFTSLSKLQQKLLWFENQEGARFWFNQCQKDVRDENVCRAETSRFEKRYQGFLNPAFCG